MENNLEQLFINLPSDFKLEDN